MVRDYRTLMASLGYDLVSQMAQPRGDLTASMAVLGLLIKRPDSPSRLKLRLVEEFPHGRWSRGIAYNDMKSLARRGLVHRVQVGGRPSEDIYAPTSEGIAAFREFIRDAAAAPPALRDAMQLWLEHSDETELPAILDVLSDLEKDAQAEYEAAQTRLNTERALGNLGPPDGSDWHGSMREMVLSDQASMCGRNAVRLKKLRMSLQNKRREVHAQEPVDGDG
jgi:DNA-binding PadR family transcriptional regulator